ncbi:sensor histidine kinase [Clostridium autoethanogenum]|uniref:histidine kinase n=1 Tax=Clostridium autoethanogenum DSM 10061 TaxID=1341692 RepID=A0ABM5NWW2_9CLOT|nr:HAMP domain-containing sensor histidine kinase [Clostridium autoethanogenum]AGY76993.1 HAMP domain-containing histidine kinase [Clostridium autoethanogenum DSM 10061]ALU37136.1 Integral membrane sensor signal transduction histidine kinase [Clostridium autoethanogenum DSM 10061]OVY50291.1 Alkaline phosphatase synthesis sensor protein PhoR [Clostridium autoethanogenum]
MLNGIKERMIGSYLFIIIFTVVIIESFLIFSISRYYYKNMENMVSNQIKVSVDFYNSYLASSSLKKNISDNADIFWKNTSAEVQVIDVSGRMLMDSIGNFIPGKVKGEDIKDALNGELGISIKTDKKTSEKVLYVSKALKSNRKVEGVLRFVTSLSEVDMIIEKISFMLIFIGIAVIIMAGIISVFISNSITRPLREVTAMARKMASGRFNERIEKKRDDEIGELFDALNFMADEILKNEKLKNEFVASVSHELRTPLTSIKGWASTMRTGDFSDKEELQTGLEIIENESDRLTKMVEELLDFSKFISGKITLKKDYVDIKNTIEYIKKQFSLRAWRQNINFSVKVQDNMPLILLDENRIKQVLNNLLDNAFKFTQEGGKVTLKAFVKDENLIMIVDDTGIGIPEDELPKVTEKFFKGKSDKCSNGIGLSICKEIVSLHGGKIEITSELVKGTEITLTIPVEDN